MTHRLLITLCILAGLVSVYEHSGGIAAVINNGGQAMFDVFFWFGFASGLAAWSAFIITGLGGLFTKAVPLKEEPEDLDDLMLRSTQHRQALTDIEAIVRQRCGAEQNTDAGDVIMHAVRDGYGWAQVRTLERNKMLGRQRPVESRLKRWI